MNEIFKSLEKMPNVVLLNSLGSVLDTQEISMENIIVLLDELSKISANVIIFETHYLTINPSILEVIKQKKTYTLLYKLYEEGKYSPVSHSNFIEVLRVYSQIIFMLVWK